MKQGARIDARECAEASDNGAKPAERKKEDHRKELFGHVWVSAGCRTPCKI